MQQATICTAIHPPWTSLEPVVLGKIPAGRGTPFCYVLVEDAGGARLRFDIHIAEPECFLYEDAIIWNDLLVIGLGSKAYCVELRTGATNTYAFGYFQSIHAAPGHCLICSDDGVINLNFDGTARWRNSGVAIDGVVISAVEDGVIAGQGEWDPPGGWSDFKIDLQTGEFIVRPNQWPNRS